MIKISKFLDADRSKPKIGKETVVGTKILLYRNESRKFYARCSV